MSRGPITTRTEVTVERRRVVVVTGRGASTVAWCSACGRETTQVTPEAAALACGVSSRSIYRAVEEGSIHGTENEDGLLWLCIESLTKRLSGGPS